MDPRAAAEATLHDYLEGVRDQDVARLRRAFSSSTNLHAVDAEGRLELVVLDRFLHFAEHQGLPEHTSEILHLDVVHDMAWARVRFTFATHRFEDALTLLRLHTGWKIVSKVYTTVR
jgi:hypothetical protein